MRNFFPGLSNAQHVKCCVKNSADDTLRYFSYSFQKIGFDISCQLSPYEAICMKILFSDKNINNLLYADFAHISVNDVSDKVLDTFGSAILSREQLL